MDRFAALEAFVSVYEAGSFSAAARRLRIGQPAVSKTVAQLEKNLGVRLLLRSTRGLTPTEAGQNFYEHAKRALEEVAEADLAARGARAGLSGRLRVCAAVTFARLLILPELKHFLDAHPELSIDVVLDDRNIDLLEEGIDVALRMGVLTESSMSARRIAQGRRRVVATPAYLAGAPRLKSPPDLAKHQVVIYDQGGGGNTWSFRRGSTEVSVTVPARVRVTAAEGIRALVLADAGVAIATEWMFGPELKNGTVKELLSDWSLPSIDLWAVYPAARMASAKARAFVAFVESIMVEAAGL